MKTSMKLLMLFALVCLVSSAASAQQKTLKKRSVSSTICNVASVPKGMVIVGYKTNPACGQGKEIIVKRPTAASEIICEDSPIPDGYVVDGLQGSLPCGGGNLLTNALSISTGATLYGIKVGMSKFEVLDEFGSPADSKRGNKTNPARGRTWIYRGKLKTTYVYFDDTYVVVGFEEKY